MIRWGRSLAPLLFSWGRHAVLCVVALPLTYLMYAPRPRSLHALPDNKYPALNVIAEETKIPTPSSSPASENSIIKSKGVALVISAAEPPIVSGYAGRVF